MSDHVRGGPIVSDIDIERLRALAAQNEFLGDGVTISSAELSALLDAAALGLAWQRAEAALPEYARIRSLVEVGAEWEAVATDGHRLWHEVGPSPAAALDALAARLREPQP